MGILKDIAVDVIEDIGADIAISALDTAASAVKSTGKFTKKVFQVAKETGKTVTETSKKIGHAVKENIDNQIDKKNTKALKKQAKSSGNTLFVSKGLQTGKGFYSIKNKQGEEIYNALLTTESGAFECSLFRPMEGQVASTEKVQQKKSIFQAKSLRNNYLLIMDNIPIGHFIQTKDGREEIMVTDYSNWIATGDLKKDNYIIFDKETGQTVATINKVHSKASMFSIDYKINDDEREAIMMAILIDCLY